MKQLLIRSRREKEAATGHNISLEELLNLYNHLIHDVEIATTSKDTKRKADKWETEDKRTKRGEAKRVNPRSFLTKNKSKNMKCVLCQATDHNVRPHHFDKHGEFPLEQIKKVLSEANRC